MLKGLKYKLSHVSEASWHFRAAESVWDERARDSKACTYYWIWLPTSLIVLAVAVLIMGVFFTISWFFGFVPRSGGTNIFMPYKTSQQGEKKRVAPWEVVTVVSLGLSGGILAQVYPLKAIEVFITFLMVSAALLGLGVVIYFVGRSWKSPLMVSLRLNVTNAWDRVCPPLVVTPKRHS